MPCRWWRTNVVRFPFLSVSQVFLPILLLSGTEKAVKNPKTCGQKMRRESIAGCSRVASSIPDKLSVTWKLCPCSCSYVGLPSPSVTSIWHVKRQIFWWELHCLQLKLSISRDRKPSLFCPYSHKVHGHSRSDSAENTSLSNCFLSLMCPLCASVSSSPHPCYAAFDSRTGHLGQPQPSYGALGLDFGDI